MKTKMSLTRSLAVAAMTAAALIAIPVNAQEQLLAIEFNEDDQDGFDFWPSELRGLSESTADFTTDAATTSGTTTVKLTTNTSFSIPANRGSSNGDPVGYTYQNLYEDLLHAASPTGAITFDFSGLLPNTTYRFTLFAWDPGAGDGSDKVWTVTEGNANPSVIGVNFQDALVDNNTFALVFDVTTTETGTFQVTNTAGLPQSAINGFKLESLEATAPLEITAIDFSADKMLTLTWNSREGANYALKFSSDLVNWDADVDDGIGADAGSSTTKTFDLSEAPLANFEKLFFRVELVPIAVGR